MVKLQHSALPAIIIAAAGILALSGCTSSTGQADAYPNINIVPQGETAQLSDAEAQAKTAQLYAQADAQRQNGESAEAYLARLRRLQQLGSTHAAAALKAIEASQ